MVDRVTDGKPEEGQEPSLDQWLTSRGSSSIPGCGDPPAVRKGYTFEQKEVDPEARTVTATISTGSVDRQGDTVDPNGWDLERYLQNPVVLWAHDYRSLPIARAFDVKVQGKGSRAKLKATARFETFPFADAVFNLIKSGTLNATSVGFIPLEWNFAEDEEDRGYFAMDITKAELLEYSIVPVPANAEALIGAKGLSRAHKTALYEWASEAIDEDRPIVGLDKQNLTHLKECWGVGATHYLGHEETLDLAQENLRRISVDKVGDVASIQLTGNAPITISLGGGASLDAVQKPQPLTTDKSRALQSRLRKLRLDSIRRKDTSLH
jgi:HK97 family phage prohead protease